MLKQKKGEGDSSTETRSVFSSSSHHEKDLLEGTYLGGNVLSGKPYALIDQRTEHGSPKAGVAGSNPANRAVITTLLHALFEPV